MRAQATTGPPTRAAVQALYPVAFPQSDRRVIKPTAPAISARSMGGIQRLTRTAGRRGRPHAA